MTYEHINPPPRRRAKAGETPQQDPADGPPDDTEEKVGYGNPPKQHRWQKGTSGNPKGKVPGTKSLHTLIDQELDIELEVTERGKKRKHTKRRIAAMRLVNKAVEGDDKALALLLRREGNMSIVAPAAAAVSNEPLSKNEELILNHFMEAARIAAARELLEGDP